MSERLTDERIEGLRQDSIYERMIVGSDVRRLILELRHYKKLAEERGKALEWASRIIDSGMGAGFLRYDPTQWFIEYHSLQEGDTHE